jgi:hypothetical protein
MRNFGTLALGASFASVLTLLGHITGQRGYPAVLRAQALHSRSARRPRRTLTVNTETGTVIGGHLNDNPAQLLTFTGTEALAGDGSGQASVGALDTLLNTAVSFALTGATFNLATFNLSPLSGNNPNEATSVQVSYTPTFGGSPLAFTLDGNGNNFFGIYGDAGEQLQSITFGNFLSSANGHREHQPSARWWRSIRPGDQPARSGAGAGDVDFAAGRVRRRWRFSPDA